MKPTLESALATFGAKAKSKLSNVAAAGQSEDQIRAPFEQLLEELGELCNLPKGTLTAVGESSVCDLKTRPDYAITVHNALVGFVELKAPGKGGDPRKFKDVHDKAQWAKLRALPNLIYTDGNSFSLWQDGELVGSVIGLIGDIEVAGNKLQAPPSLLGLFESFFQWQPISPKSAKELARSTARLCRLLRDEVTEQLALKSPALTELATDWRKLLFPEATDEKFADGYAQAVTFGLLMARAKNIVLSNGLQQAGTTLSQSSSLIGAALRLLTDNADNQATLKTSLGTLTRVLDAVDWKHISKGSPDAWLYFYEDFLEVYDNQLRKQTGSYYTPPEVVGAMVNLVDEVLRSSRFSQHEGLAAQSVTVADPALGTGTFLLGVLRKIAETVESDEGKGSVKGAVQSAIKRLIGFEMQLGPFAVAQLRLLAEVVDLTSGPAKTPIRLFVTNTLGNPNDDEGWIPGILAPIANSRKDANKIKRDETITVVIGNPPYKEKAKGQGGWVESGGQNESVLAPFTDWIPPTAWKIGAHAKHLRNLYIYFWRWATWKVFDHHDTHNTGIVCFITVGGFLNGPGFQKMRDYLRRTCDDIWVIDCSPEGHQPEVNTRIFQGVQQPVCIVLASRSSNNHLDKPATVLFQALPEGHRKEKFNALGKLSLTGVWSECPSGWRAPFLPSAGISWATFPALESIFVYGGSGVMPGRTWIISPDIESLEKRWQTLTTAASDRKEVLFHPHLRNGEPGDKHSKRIVSNVLHGQEARPKAVADDNGPCIAPVRYGFRSFDRQYIIPDNRIINQPNPDLWKRHSNRQVYLTVLSRTSPTTGPAVTFTGLIPDLDHYNGRGGRVFPLWQDQNATRTNFAPALLLFLSQKYGIHIPGDDFMAYVGAIMAHPGFAKRFQKDLSTPGLKIPVTADADLFREACEVGRKIIWLHTFGERMSDSSAGRPAQPPRLPSDRSPRIPAAGEIPQSSSAMPNNLVYDAEKKRLLIGRGYVERVEPFMWNYEVSGKQVLLQWFSYRKANRDRPIIGKRRPPSPLGEIQPDYWLSEYTTELLNVLNVIGLLVDLEPAQANLLERICVGALIPADELKDAGAFAPFPQAKKSANFQGPDLFGNEH